MLLFTTDPSGPPLNATPTTVTSRSIVLQWEPPLPEDRNGPITSYSINVSVVDTGETLALTSITPLLYLDMLLPYTEYAFTIAAHTEVGYGPSSTAISITTLEEGKITHNNIAILILFNYFLDCSSFCTTGTFHFHCLWRSYIVITVLDTSIYT